MAEQFVNDVQTALAAPAAPGDLTITVADASALPGAGNFRLRVDNEILLVTAVAGAVLTVTRAAEAVAGVQAAAAHANGAVVTHVLTAASVALAAPAAPVSSVANSDGTLTVSPTTGAVVASLALGHANTWTGQQTFGTVVSIHSVGLQVGTASAGGSITAVASAAGAGQVTTHTGSAAGSGNTNGGPNVFVGGLKSGSGADGANVFKAASAAPGGNIVEVQSSTGTVLASVNATGVVGTAAVTSTADLTFTAPSGKNVFFLSGGGYRWYMDPNGHFGAYSANLYDIGQPTPARDIYASRDIIVSGLIATTATAGFLYIPTCAGTPTGVPTGHSGCVPMIYDTTAHKLWIYDGGWKTTTAFS